jgi:hypothetical protein
MPAVSADRRWIATCAASAMLASAHPVHAGGAACGPIVQARAATMTWRAAIDAVSAELTARADVERCVTITMEPEGAGVRVTVTASDGREAVRHVAAPDDLRTTIVALVLLPPAPPNEPREPPPPATAEVIAPIIVRDELAVGATAPAALRPLADAIALGLSTGVERSVSSTGGSLDARVEASRGRWSLALAGRWSAGQAGGYADRAAEVGAELGYRFELGPVTVTTSAGPRIAHLAASPQAPLAPTYVEITNPKTGAVQQVPVADVREGDVLRVGGSVRVSLRTTARVRLFALASATIDAGADPANDVPMLLVLAPSLPTWSAGLWIGGEVRAWP